MAVAKRRHSGVDYRNLHYLSSVVLYDTSKRPRNNFFNVDRIIEKRNVGHVSTAYHNKVSFRNDLIWFSCEYFVQEICAPLIIARMRNT